MAVLLSPVGGVAGQFFDNNGNPLTGGKMYSYVAGTTTPQATYTSSAGVVAHSNPIILDAGGRVPGGEIWLTDGLQYKFVLKNASDVLIGTYDNIIGINSNFVNFLTETEVQTATAGQTVFTLATMQYQPGTNNLTVYVDGVNQIDGSTYSYVETSSTVITFTAGLHVGALVKFTTAQTLSTGVTDSSLVTYTPAGTGAVVTNVQTKLREYVSVKDFGAVGDGVIDDTAAIQAALDFAAGMFNTTGFPPTGTFNSTIVTFPPGAYRITDTLDVYVGLTVTGQSGIAYSVESTRVIMDTSGGTVNQNKNIFNLTTIFQSVSRNNNMVCTIQDIGFWITNPGSTIPARGGTAWGYGTYTGSAIYCSESAIDIRIKRCNFYSVPNAAIWFNQATNAPASNVVVHECEFDTSNVGILFNKGNIALTCTDNEFYTNFFGVNIESSVGTIDMYSNVFQLGCPTVYAITSSLTYFNFVGNDVSAGGGSGSALNISVAANVNISNNVFGVTTNNTIRLTNATNGAVSNNTIVNSGYNTVATNPLTDAGAIVLSGCADVVVSGNSITTPDAATYSGFGILTLGTSSCTIIGNIISNSYTNTAYRTQSRKLNISATDTLVGNTIAGGVDSRVIQTPHGGFVTQPQFVISTSTTTNIDLTGFSTARVVMNVCPVSSSAVFNFEILIGYNNFAGTYNILNVNKNGVVGSGNGPFTISAGTNTLAFSISTTQLVLTTSIATDPIAVSYELTGAKQS